MNIKQIFFFGITFLLISCNSSESKEKDQQVKEKLGDTMNENSNEKTAKSDHSKITCPNCKHTEIEVLPIEFCLIKYDCKKCNYEMRPKEGDCCVFCTYGDHKCPSMQE